MTTNHCPNCQTAIPSGAPGGFCPACVLRGAEESAPVTAQSGPSLDEVRAAFPQLEIECLIGQGGMGSVYKARQPSLDRIVAMKILSPALSRDPAFAERFAREARVLGRLSHPNIVTVYEHGQSGAFYYLLMEYVDGVNLRQAMQAGRFTPEQALAVVPGICDALQAAHAQGIWHRDIKPENILLDARGGVKIADFGIARLAGDPQQAFTLTMTGARLGSAAYMAPEQHEKPHDVDHRADIYSLGVVIYEMLTGELPLGRFKAPSTKAAVDARIDEIVLRTLEKERELRQQSAGEVKTEMQGAASGKAPGSTTPRSQKSPQFLLASKGALIGGIVLFIMAVIFTFGSTLSVLLAISATAVVLGGLGLLFGRRAAPVPDDNRAASITVRSLWMFLGGVCTYAVAEWIDLYGTRYSLVAVDLIRMGIIRAMVLFGAVSAIAGWCGLWYALSQMKRGTISTRLRGFARTCAWMPIVLFLASSALWVKRRDAARQVQAEAELRAQEVQRAAYQMRQEAENAQAQLKTKFPDLSTPQGAVVAFEIALEAGDSAKVLAAIPSSVAAKSAAPDEYAKQLIAKHQDAKGGRRNEEAILIFVGTPELSHGSRVGSMDKESQQRILGREPVGAMIVEYKAHLFGEKSAVLSSTQICVKEGAEWRVIPSIGPSLTVGTPPTPAPPVRTAQLVTRERIVNGRRTVVKEFVTDTGELFPSVEAANLAEQQRAANPALPPVVVQPPAPAIPAPPLPPVSSRPATPMHVQVESTDAVGLIYKMNELANAKNRDEFRKLIPARYLPYLPGFRPPSDEDLMSAFAGKIIGIWDDLPNRRPYEPMRDRVAPMPEGPGFALAAGPTAKLGGAEKHGIVEFERADGSRDYYVVAFKWGRESLGFSRLEILPYVAQTRVDFRPKEGDPKAMLSGLSADGQVTQVFENGEARAGRFDIRGFYSRTPDEAVKSANRIIDHITLQLQKAGSANAFKVVSPATAPEKPAFFSYPNIAPVVRKPEQLERSGDTPPR